MAGRRTRSQAITTEQDPPLATRASRRTKKQSIEEDEEQSDELGLEQAIDLTENLVDNDIQMESNDADQFESNNDDNGSSNYAFEENLTSEQPSEEKEEDTNQTDESVGLGEKFLAELGEENANSFPSVDETYQGVQDSLDDDFQMADEPSMDKTEDTYAQSEDLKTSDQHATDLDAENISEDELPAPTKPKVQDAEEVSDEELPGPKMAELPEDTENVSEDEFPSSHSVKKEKRKLQDYDPSDPTDENDAPEKKLKTEDEAEKKYRLPELEKYWKAVLADGDDFNAWTYLLQYVDSESDVEHAREAYDAFLSRYCYCYGYWRKYADYEKKKGSVEKCDEVFERGLKAIPLSIDLWIHYLTHVKQKYQDDRESIRVQFERALEGCGLEFRSDKLWEGFIKWESEDKNFLQVVSIYDRLLATPTQGYKNHMENFREVVNNNPVQKLLSVEEFKKMREEIRKDITEPKADDEIPPGEDEADDHLRNEEEANAIRKLIINMRKKVHKATVEMINKRWTYEEGIKRPYFHVKQLEKIQLKNWKEYLDFEIEQGDKQRILVLFERCLIACALYEEFWIKLIRYLETNQDDPEYEARTRDVYERACKIHHPDKPSLHLMWSAFEEIFGNVDKAVLILENLDKKQPNLLQVAYRRINLERRRGNLEKCLELYENNLANAKNKQISSSIIIKYARFLNKHMNQFDKAMETLKNALEKDQTNTRIALQIIDLVLQRPIVDEKEVLEVLDKFMMHEKLDEDQKLLFAQRKVEFLEDFGSSVKELCDAQKVLHATLEKSKENKRKSSEHENSSSKKAKESGSNNGTYSSSAYNYQGYSNSNNYPANNYNYDYNQWSSYGGNYNQPSSYGSYGNTY